MSFLGFGKKKHVPDELPDLISDEIEKESMKEVNSYLKEEIKKETEKPVVLETEKKPEVSNKEFVVNKNVVNRLIKNIEETPERPMKKQPDEGKSFFADLQNNLSKELTDLDSLENFYNKKFMNRDVLTDMKDYWEKQKTNNVLEILGKNFQEKISDKISNLQSLEKNWQSIYFELVEKEEEIKDAERELKELLKEFVNICKHKKESLETKSNLRERAKNISINNEQQKKEGKKR